MNIVGLESGMGVGMEGKLLAWVMSVPLGLSGYSSGL
jgi:hypothetical protein